MTYAPSSIYSTLYGTKHFIGGALTSDKKYFLLKVFFNLIVQLSITYFIMTKTHLNIQQWILMISLFAIILLLSLVPMHPFLKFILFCIFSFINGVLLSSIQTNQSTLQYAILSTISIFVAMILAGVILLLFGIQFGPITFFFLFAALLVALIISLLQFFVMSINNKLLSNAIIGLFALFIIYDTQQILKRNYYGDYITASMDYYLDILNIFVRLLRR